MLAVDRFGEPVGRARMYDEPCNDEAVMRAIAEHAPAESAARGATSALARVLMMQGRPNVRHMLHQADWISGKLSGRFDRSDWNNALKTGYDPVAARWPDWIERTGADLGKLPVVLEPGAPIGPVSPEAVGLGIPESVIVHAGTTDGCASFLATGASEAGDGVTALGSTLVVKLLCDHPIFAPEFGIYSHRIGSNWLAGGASNTGGKVIEQFFPRDRLAELSAGMKPENPTGLSYYPLPKPGERFPINDPKLPPRLEPRPKDDTTFFQAILEGVAEVEALAYRKLAELGAPPLRSVRTVGGGAANSAWTKIRERKLRAPFKRARVAGGMCGRGSSRVAKPSQFRVSALSRFIAIASSFKAVFFDQYGVLHDGRNPYPGARDALAALKSRGVGIVVLSNSGRTGAANAERMTTLGFEPELYDFLVTSGDVARTLLKRGRFPALLAPGARCFIISTGGDDEFATALGVVPDRLIADEADLVVIAGSQADKVSLDDYRELLAPAARRGTPCMCTNPDKLMLTASGNAPGAGRIAEIYEELGGDVTWVGKPFPEIYRSAAEFIAGSGPARHSLCWRQRRTRHCGRHIGSAPSPRL